MSLNDQLRCGEVLSGLTSESSLKPTCLQASDSGARSTTQSQRAAVVMIVAGREAIDDVTGPRNRSDLTTDTAVHIVRLEKVSSKNLPNVDGVQLVVRGGPFDGVIVRKSTSDGLPPVRKPNVRTEFRAFLGHRDDCERPRRQETRDVLFWFGAKTGVDEQKLRATQYFKLLIEPETFPRDYVGFIKKAILLLRHFAQIKRVQLGIYTEPEPEVEEDEESNLEEKPIENFITVITPAVYDYQYLPEVPVSKKTHLTFRVRAGADAHIALSNVYGDTDRKTYEVVLGGWDNTRSAIRYGGRGPAVVHVNTPGILDATDFRPFWICWRSDVLQVGTGLKVGKEVTLRWRIPTAKLHSINCMSVSTGPGSDGQWEFIEFLDPSAPKNDMKVEKINALRRAVLWYAKKTKMLETLEEAFPACLNMADLLKRSRVSLSDMLEAVIFLKDLNSRGLVCEISRGVWLRSPISASAPGEVKMVDEFPAFSSKESPTVAIVTSLFCEKLAVDAMLDAKVTFVKYNPNAAVASEKTQSFTLGRIGDRRIVSIKLPLLYSNSEATAMHGSVVANLLATFNSVQHVMIVGTAGAVPNYTDYDKHVRLGDIVVSSPKTPGAPMYLHCQDVSVAADGGDHRSYATRVWEARPDSVTQAAVRQLVDAYCSGRRSSLSGREPNGLSAVDRRPWERLIDSVGPRLDVSRPQAKSDRLFAVLEPGSEPVQVRHPTPRPGSAQGHRENLPNVRCGTIASGRSVAGNVAWRMEVSGDIVAFDRGLHEVVDAVDGLCCAQRGRPVDYILALGVVDYLDGCKGRTWQPYGALCAAAFVRTLVGMLGSVGTGMRYPMYYK